MHPGRRNLFAAQAPVPLVPMPWPAVTRPRLRHLANTHALASSNATAAQARVNLSYAGQTWVRAHAISTCSSLSARSCWLLLFRGVRAWNKRKQAIRQC